MKVNRVKRIPVAKIPKRESNRYSSEMGYGTGEYSTIEELFSDDEFFIDEEMDVTVKYVGAAKAINLSFNIREFEHCCGAKEVGGLSGKVLNDKDTDAVFLKLFEEINNKTVIITTVKSQKEWEGYLGRTKLFQDVKTYTNNSTKHVITLWVSTN